MNAILLLRRRLILDETSFVAMTVWELPRMLPGSAHSFKYSLAYVVDGVCVLRYDNEAGKGDHRHIDGREVPYEFSTLDKLTDDFWRDVEARR